MQEVEFQLPHIRLQGLSGGNPDGPLLLALHGWLDNCHSFLPMAPYLNDYNWLFIDFPGHGYSDHRAPDAHYYFVDWVYDIECLIRQQGWQDIHLVGHSMGGYVAEVLGALYPESFAKLTLIEAFGLLPAAADETLQQLRKGLDSRFKQNGRRAPVYADLNHLVQARARAGELTPELAELLLQRNLQQVEGGHSWRTDPRVRTLSPFRFTPEQISDILKNYRLPVQLILGSEGHQDLHRALEKWGDLVTDKSVHEVPGGHHVHMQQPQQIAALLKARY
ncbi:alpha/beta hydrolase [Aliidiomarina minuta]|uniref:Alpha/beta hydrolase n=1 Tax=Aliidiomarina minuta TaxID=880057 RepID=A0A432W7Z0_9GAMM|nr:alpha/beta hydrolase [Aliidiomarina minuta]RUO26175.1 alpha/beta hydrolase [Aliidiomarina minuta]